MDAAELGALGLSAGDVQHAAWWVDEGGRLSRGHWAIAEAMVAAGGVRAGVGRVLRSGAVGWIALPAYRLVVSNRHRMPGGSVACRVDSPH
jgi:hypothetical protein